LDSALMGHKKRKKKSIENDEGLEVSEQITDQVQSSPEIVETTQEDEVEEVQRQIANPRIVTSNYASAKRFISLEKPLVVKKRVEPSFFSFYFIAPAILVTVLSQVLDYLWKNILMVDIYAQKDPELFHGLEEYSKAIWMMSMWCNVIFVIAVLKLARGDIIMGFVHGGILSSVLNFNVQPIIYWHVGSRHLNLQLVQLDFLWHVCKGSLLAQIAVLLATFFIPQQTEIHIMPIKQKEE